MQIARPGLLPLPFLLMVSGICASGWAAGGGVLNDPVVQLTSDERSKPPEKVRAWARFQTVSFRLNSVEGKYKIVPVVVENHGADPVSLSAATDRITVVAGDRTLAGVVELHKTDRTLWDSWDLSLHRMLTYPERVRPDEAVLVYVFVPRADVPETPTGVDYLIQSLGRTLKLRAMPAMAAMAE